MTKKIFALVMVVSVLGVFLAGCSKGEDKPADATAPATTAGTPAPAAGTDAAPAPAPGK